MEIYSLLAVNLKILFVVNSSMNIKHPFTWTCSI